jgi:hypothetical protein
MVDVGTYTPGLVFSRYSAALNDAYIFDAVNSIERRYRPYLVQITVSKNASQDAAAATAAGTVLVALHPDKAGELQAALAKSCCYSRQ